VRASGRGLARITGSSLDAFETIWSPAGGLLAYTRDAPG
jgi:hypothetical protein